MLHDACKHYEKSIQFMGPKASVMRKIGNKLDGKTISKKAWGSFI